MKLEVGMYVRVNGRKSSSVKYQNCFMIDKIRHIDNGKSKYRYLVRPDKDDYCLPISEEMIVKASHNIIDLIEVGDYVNGDRIDEIENGELRFHWDYEYCEYISYYENEDIKSIVTKEQFESMSYKVGD